MTGASQGGREARLRGGKGDMWRRRGAAIRVLVPGLLTPAGEEAWREVGRQK